MLMIMADCFPDDVGETPNQPRNFKFPKRTFGKTTRVIRSFQAAWFAKWGWLHYNASSDVAYCHTCVCALKSGKMKVTTCRTKESSFAVGGFWNWKDATVAFSKHESSATHKLAVNVMLTLPATNADVGQMLCAGRGRAGKEPSLFIDHS